MESWYFTPKVGISSSIARVNFGNSSEDIKNILGNTCHNMTENVGGTGAWLRLEYDYEDKLICILFCVGSLVFEDTEIFLTTKSQLKQYLEKKFTVCIPQDYFIEGEYCPDICMGFASDVDNGGKTDNVGTINMFYSEQYWDQI
jgi:hypothetical protein